MLTQNRPEKVKENEAANNDKNIEKSGIIDEKKLLRI